MKVSLDLFTTPPVVRGSVFFTKTSSLSRKKTIYNDAVGHVIGVKSASFRQYWDSAPVYLPLLTVIMLNMFRLARHQFQVFQRIIEFIVVFMMNLLLRFKLTPNTLFHNVAMLKDASTPYCKQLITIRSQSSSTGLITNILNCAVSTAFHIMSPTPVSGMSWFGAFKTSSHNSMIGG